MNRNNQITIPAKYNKIEINELVNVNKTNKRKLNNYCLNKDYID